MQFSQELFSGLVSQRFAIGVDENPMHTCDLLSATPLYSDHKMQQFSLLFKGRDFCGLSQGTYKFEHPSVGLIDIFISPLAPVPGIDGPLFEAVFSIIRPS